jgi:endonuclease/exonuclease/phosphatase family metal-dependent hydrolase
MRAVEERNWCAAQPGGALVACPYLFESRGAVIAEVQAPSGPVWVVNTHMFTRQTPFYERTHEQAIRHLLDVLGPVVPAGAPIVITCDCNAEPGTALTQVLAEAGFVDAHLSANPGEDGFTAPQAVNSPSSALSARIDYIWAKGPQVCTTEALPNAPTWIDGVPWWPSDHRQVVASLAVDGSCG